MMMRFDRHPILSFERNKQITFTFNGKSIRAYYGETIAAALQAAGIRVLSHSLKYHRPRGFFCAIGKCSSCMMEVNGIPNVKTCMIKAEQSMVVKSQTGSGVLYENKRNKTFENFKVPLIETDLAIIGAGPAGLSSALFASKYGIKTTVFDENTKIGGQLIKQTHMFFGSKEHYAGVRGIDIEGNLSNTLKDSVKIFAETPVVGYYPEHQLAVIKEGKLHRVRTKKIIVATGASENMLAFPNNDLPGVYGAGAVQTLMNVHGILPGKRVLMVGAGNIGLIVSYQLLQAGVDVAGIIEALPVIGGYQVHASKIRRCGVPILTGHTIKQALGKEKVEGAVIVRIDKDWNEIKNSKKTVEVDTICLSVGLNPSSEFLHQAGCRMVNIPELGGEIPLRNENLETTVEGIYIAGDAAGIEEASSAMLEGRLAGLDVVEKLNGPTEEIKELKTRVKKDLKELREGPFGEKIRTGEKKLTTLKKGIFN
jgi:sarcosine oxidase subunit alpha